MTEYKPQKGDRVRVTVEGVVHDSGGKWFDLGGNYFDVPYDGPHEATYTIEKLQDPEPEWVDGDVIKVGHWLPAYRIKGNWVVALHGYQHYMLSTDPDIVSKSWQSGDLDILLKADAQKVA